MKGTGLLVDWSTANHLVADRLAEVANVRTHASLGERPLDRWRQERTALLPLPQQLRRDEATLLGHDRLRPMPHESVQHPLSIREACA